MSSWMSIAALHDPDFGSPALHRTLCSMILHSHAFILPIVATAIAHRARKRPQKRESKDAGAKMSGRPNNITNP